jgi:hypothetical protein
MRNMHNPKSLSCATMHFTASVQLRHTHLTRPLVTEGTLGKRVKRLDSSWTFLSFLARKEPISSSSSSPSSTPVDEGTGTLRSQARMRRETGQCFFPLVYAFITVDAVTLLCL